MISIERLKERADTERAFGVNLKHTDLKIAILSHWHTGSTLAAKTFRVCGMNVGNEKTGWNPQSCDAQCEHSLLNRIGDRLSVGQVDRISAQIAIEKILTSYKRQAQEHGWNCYGFKITHALQTDCWKLFKTAIDYVWGKDTIFVTTLRHPVAIAASTANDPAWTREMILNSWYDCLPAMKQIAKMPNSVVLRYPNDWVTYEIRKKIEAVGLAWSVEAADLWYGDRPRVFPEAELTEFYYADFPEGIEFSPRN